MTQGRSARSDFVVGWRNGAIGHEDEKTWTKLFDRAFPFDAGWVNGAHGEDAIKLALKASFVDLESDVVPGVAPLCRLAGQTDEVAQRRGEDAVALVDHVLRVAQEMGEADLLVLLRPAGLGAVAIGDPGVRANGPEERPTASLERRGWREETGVLAMVENP